ncbi:translation initiation factor eIF-2B subunit delta [Tremella mesenterica]|uniref:Translation initiation factor eIF2B subunit delta n=1 Tax=Tremella mesenterica TaxID=5217 RepID=A0A4Q1BW46_TREME|nr:translation initiation factor eIF-2B subunit delta [Tremella mesenterica]
MSATPPVAPPLLSDNIQGEGSVKSKVVKTDPKKSAKEAKKEKRAALVASRAVSQSTDNPTDLQPQPSPNLSTQIQSPSQSQFRTTTSRPPQQPPTSSIPSKKSQPIGLPDLPSTTTSTHKYWILTHLPTHASPNTPLAFKSGKLHPIIIRLGVLMSSGTLRGANARTIGMMIAFQEVIRDYETPENAVLWKDLPGHLSPMISFLENCRPKGVGGGNAIRWLKGEINRFGEQEFGTEAEQKQYLIDAIGVYIRDRIEFADQVIATTAKEKIKPGDTVVTYARSSLVERVLIEAWTSMRILDPSSSFSVIIVDSRPLLEGRSLLTTLSSYNIPITYTLLPLLAPLLPSADLVLLGTSALHADGSLYSRAGTAMIAMLAKEARIPVVACCETYKFGERVVLDGVGSNELGDVSDFFDVKEEEKETEKGKGKGMEGVIPLSLLYDLTPPSLITAVCTEIGFIPPSSVPTVLGKANNVV